MKTYTHLWERLCSYNNLERAFRKARRRKTKKLYVQEFEKNLNDHLEQLRIELLLHSYKPRSLITFIVRDPKTRKISKSDFRDRVIHHALCNVIDLLFEKTFIYDSFANQKGKGTLKAIQRFDQFKRKVYNKKTKEGYVFKADIRHYFNEINHNILLTILKRKIKDEKVLWLIKQIINNQPNGWGEQGLPLGNLTSQFFANIYLNELDQFVKHQLKAKYYIRYVDDFVILHKNKQKLTEYRERINLFLREKLALELHPGKSKIIPLKQGINFLGLRVFYHYKLLRKTNLRKMKRTLEQYKRDYKDGKIIYDTIYEYLQGWLAYAKQANTHKLRKRLVAVIEQAFPNEIATLEINKLLKIYQTNKTASK